MSTLAGPICGEGRLEAPRLATADDHQAIVELIDLAAGWLRTKGTDQWARPWPSHKQRDKRIAKSIEAGATWIIWDGSTAVATITMHRDGNSKLWKRKERRQPALYAHRLVVNRAYAGRGIGEWLLAWAAQRAARKYRAELTRIDVWTSNTALHAYYRRLGFEFVRRAKDEGYPAGALFQRPIVGLDGNEVIAPSVAYA
jgi:ribosomal protein S18 acetylase RimI-like enzyme